jgi:hypothetical protein
MGTALVKRNITPQVYKAFTQAVKKEPRDTARIVDDMRKDPVFQLGIKVLRSMASSVVVSFDVDGDDPRAQRLASHCADLWDQNARHALEAIEYGRQAFEIVHGINGDLNTIAELIPIPYEISEVEIDKESGFRSVIKVGKGKSQVELIPQHYLWIALDATRIEPFGKSRYRGAAYQVRQQRKKLDQQEETWYNRYSMGVGLAFAPEEAIGTPIAGDGDRGEIATDGNPVDPAKALRDALEELKAGGWMILSSATYPEGGGRKWGLEQFPEVKEGSPIANRRNHLDVAALRSLGIPERAVIQEGQTGSYSLAEAHALVLNDTVEDIARQVIIQFQKQIVDRLCRLNEINGRITMTWKPIGDKSDQQANEIVRAVITSSTPSPLVTEGVIDFPKIAESIGFPLGSDAAQALKRIADKASAPSLGFGGQSLALSMLDDVMKIRQGKLHELGGCCG